ncbi:hypothetical protein T35B1_14374 [Salinisphaera shabanensis T35B1]|uniref:lipopolysaccharide kinase InaA family protein n=1 Tax=Salinisphaera shabanensis TaxID=180542 RepID=UPI0033406D94
MAMTLRRGVLASRDVWWMDAAVAARCPDFARAETIYEGTYTRITRHPDCPGLISKLSRVKTAPRDHVRKYWASQAKREMAANRIMQGLGIKTASLIGQGIRIAPWARAESLLFMDELPPHETLRVVLTRSLGNAQRATLLDRVARDIAVLYRNGYHHKDCHLENVLLTQAGAAILDTGCPDLVWIDNDLRYSAREDRACRRLDASLRQLAFTSRHFISPDEWRLLADRLRIHLAATELGRVLAATCVPAFTQDVGT